MKSLIGAIFTILTLGVTIPYTERQFNELRYNKGETIKAYTKTAAITEPFEFTVGQKNENGYDFRLVLVLLDNNFQFPSDFDQIGTLEAYTTYFAIDPEELIRKEVKIPLELSHCTYDYISQLGKGHELFIPEPLIPQMLCLDEGQQLRLFQSQIELDYSQITIRVNPCRG